jgi:hypothetical protein
MGGVFAALLDTCVLWLSLQRDFLLSMAIEGLYRPLWSEAILQELHRHERYKLTDRGGEEADAPAQADRLLDNMRVHFDDALVTGWEPLEGTFDGNGTIEPLSPTLHVSTVQPDRVGLAAPVDKPDVDGLAGPAQRDRVDVFLAVHGPADRGNDWHRWGQRVLRHPGGQAVDDRLGIPVVLGCQRRSMQPSSVGGLTANGTP